MILISQFLKEAQVFMGQRAGTIAGTMIAASFVGAISIAPLLVVIYGFLGRRGDSLATAALIALPSVLFICAALYARYRPRLDLADLCFCGFLFAVLISFLTNQMSVTAKDITLLILTAVLAYPSGRVVQVCQIKLIRLYCFWISAGILILGTTATLYNLAFFSWGVERPIVFGFDHTVSVLSLSLGYFVICSIYQVQRWKSATALFSTALIAISAFVFAASLVRFSLIATALAITLAAVLSPRRFTFLCMLVFSISTAAGLAAQSSLTTVMMGYIAEVPKQAGEAKLPKHRDEAELPKLGDELELPKHAGNINSRESRKDIDTTPNYLIVPLDITPQQSAMPSCKLKVNLRNSVVIREVLYLDALALAPTVGLFGYGLNSFSRMGCLRGYEVHNVVVQAFMEFGWFGGISFCMLLTIPFWRLFPLAWKDPDVGFMFVLCGFIVLIDMAHGRLNTELPLFVSIGAIVGVLTTRNARRRPSADCAIASGRAISG